MNITNKTFLYSVKANNSEANQILPWKETLGITEREWKSFDGNPDIFWKIMDPR